MDSENQVYSRAFCAVKSQKSRNGESRATRSIEGGVQCVIGRNKLLREQNGGRAGQFLTISEGI